jgi:hypothetical protein
MVSMAATDPKRWREAQRSDLETRAHGMSRDWQPEAEHAESRIDAAHLVRRRAIVMPLVVIEKLAASRRDATVDCGWRRRPEYLVCRRLPWTL